MDSHVMAETACHAGHVTDMTSLPKATLDGLQSFIQTEQFHSQII
jgi:hypothetical protein